MDTILESRVKKMQVSCGHHGLLLSGVVPNRKIIHLNERLNTSSCTGSNQSGVCVGRSYLHHSSTKPSIYVHVISDITITLSIFTRTLKLLQCNASALNRTNDNGNVSLMNSLKTKECSRLISRRQQEQQYQPKLRSCHTRVAKQTTISKSMQSPCCNNNAARSIRVISTLMTLVSIMSLLAQTKSQVSAFQTSADGQSIGTCFGGLQTFEKISMSSFEPSPILTSSSAATATTQSSSQQQQQFFNQQAGGGILVQQDDQALTSECVNLCKSQSNCLSFVIDYNKFECKSYAITQQQLQQQQHQQQAAAATSSANDDGPNLQGRSQSASSSSSINASADDTLTLSASESASAATNRLNSGNNGSGNSTNNQQRLLLPTPSANYFEKICLTGVATRQEFTQVCGQDRLWAVERVVDAFLDGFIEKEITNVNSKDECSKLCLFENQFVCRSADYDQNNRLCRLSKEDRRTQPQAFRANLKDITGRHYIENQCATPGPSSCVYELKRNVGVVSMDALKYAQNVNDCQMKCSQEQTFNCRSYSYHNNRCFLSGDDSVSLGSLVKLPAKMNWQFGERKCVVELCTKGIFTYEKISGFTLRSALSTTIDLLATSQSAHNMASMAYRMMPLVSGGDGHDQTFSSSNQEDLSPETLANVAEQMSTAEAMTNRLLRRNYLQSTPISHEDPLVEEEAELTRSIAGWNDMANNPGEHHQARHQHNGHHNHSHRQHAHHHHPPTPHHHHHQHPQHRHSHHHHSQHHHHANRTHSNYHHQNNSGGSGSNLAITSNCRQACDAGYLNCPSFTIDYKNNRCQRLDRNSQGRHQDLVARDGHSYFEKICLRVPEIMSMCQDKYWIFERVLGYELAPHLYQKTLKFVLSRRDCEEYCLEEKQFQCRSALYNDETSDCKLSQTDRRLSGQDGYYRNFNAKVSYLENQCIRNHQLERDNLCHYEQPKNEPSYPTFTEFIETAPPAATTTIATTLLPMEPASSDNSSLSEQSHGIAYCEQLCNDNIQFECHSFGYYSSTNQCFLSGDDLLSVGESAITSSPGFVYYEKRCSHSNDDATTSSIQLNNATTLASANNGAPVTQATFSNNGVGDIDSQTNNNNGIIPSPSTVIAPTSSADANSPIAGDGLSNQANLLSQQKPPIDNNIGQGGRGPQPATSSTSGGSGSFGLPISANRLPASEGSVPGGSIASSGMQTTNININIQPLSEQLTPSSRLPTTTVNPSSSISSNNHQYTTTESPHGLTNQNNNQDNNNGLQAVELTADTYKCGQGNVFSYQRIAGFEPIGGFLTLLLHDNQQAGIVDECAQLCKRAYECRAFVVDYNSNQCYAMLENSSMGPQLSLRQSIGRDYFEGFCIAQQHLYSAAGQACANKTWISDRIVDQAVIGVQAQQIIEQSDRASCRLACFEQRLFYCKSAMFDSQTRECRLYAIDRESTLHMSLLFTKGVDFFENQCQIQPVQCPYDAIERDITIITATKSLQGHSTFDCEQACNEEQTFNCRSYTYLHNYPDQLPNICILSSDSRSTSQKGSIRERKRTLYVERNCFNRKPRRPSPSETGTGSSFVLPVATNPATNGGAGIEPSTSYNGGANLQGGVSQSTGFKVQIVESQLPPSSASTTDSRVVTMSESAPSVGICEPHQYTFERTFGYDYRFARRERVPVPQSLGVVVACQQECLLRYDRCQAFVVEYSLPYQGCFLLDSSVGANKKLLVKSSNMAYYEKICLVRTGIDNDLAVQQAQSSLSSQPQQFSSQLNIVNYPSTAVGHSDGVATGQQASNNVNNINYEQPGESWGSSQSANQLPYYMQQQRLVQQYPSRACARLWSFERVPNGNFTLVPDRNIPNVLSRLLCEQYCINEARFTCRSAVYDYNNLTCRLYKETRRSTLSQFITLSDPLATVPNIGGPSSKSARQLLQATGDQSTSSSIAQSNQEQQMLANIDYMENQCVQQPSSCQYRPIYHSFSPFIDKIMTSVSLSDCQRQCDLERLFRCRAINYDPTMRECMLLNEDLLTLDKGQQSLIPRKNTIYSEKGNCELVSVQCNPQEMLVSINFDTPFRGRILANGNPEQCFILGDGQTTIHFPILFGPKCNSRQEGHNTFVNEVVIQQHPVIMTDSDKTVRVMCSFEAPDQTITLKNPSDNGGGKAGIDVSNTPENSRTRHDRPPFNSVISNKSSPPMVILRILDLNDRDATMINLGDDLVLKIQMQGGQQQQASALGIFARNLRARSSNGESLLLIDNDGCPIDNAVFPALSIDSKDGKSLFSTFKAFRFPSSGLVNFEVQIRFCPERCQPVQCNRGQLQSYGKRRRRRRRKRDIMQPVSVNSSRVDATSLVEGSRVDATSLVEAATELVGTVNLSVAQNHIKENSSLESSKDQLSNANQNNFHTETSSLAQPLPSAITVDGGEIMKPGRAFQMLREMLLSETQPFYKNPTEQVVADSGANVSALNSKTSIDDSSSYIKNDNASNTFKANDGEASVSTMTLMIIDNTNLTSNNDNSNSNLLHDEPSAQLMNDMQMKNTNSAAGFSINQDFLTSYSPETTTTIKSKTVPEFIMNDSNKASSNIRDQSSSLEINDQDTIENRQPMRSLLNSDTVGASQREPDSFGIERMNREQISADYQSVLPPILTHVDERVIPNYINSHVSSNLLRHSDQPQLINDQIQRISTMTNEPRIGLDRSQWTNINRFPSLSNNVGNIPLSSNPTITYSVLHHRQPHIYPDLADSHTNNQLHKNDLTSITTSIISNSRHSSDPVRNVDISKYPITMRESSASNHDYSSIRTRYQPNPSPSQFDSHSIIESTFQQPPQAMPAASTLEEGIFTTTALSVTGGHLEAQDQTNKPTIIETQSQRSNSRASAAEVPLKFSILVGDQSRHQNHLGSAIGSASWPSNSDLSTDDGLAVKNNFEDVNKPILDNTTTSVLDQPNQGFSIPDNSSNMPQSIDPVNKNTEIDDAINNFLPTINNINNESAKKPGIGLSIANSINVTHHKQGLENSSSDNTVINNNDSNFDILPSDNSLDPLLLQSTNNRSSVTTLQSQAELTHADCPIDNASSRLWLIVWTGTIVIALNVGLVVISLVIYFKKIHLIGRHNVRSLHRGGNGKNPNSNRKHLSTSLEASEHFFAKLNQGQSRAITRASSRQHSQTNARKLTNQTVGEFNWPNLSSSSSHSTISSIACPPPPAITTVNASRPNRNCNLLQHQDLSHLQHIVAHRPGMTASLHQTEFYNIDEIDNDDDDNDNIITCTVNGGFEHDDDDDDSTQHKNHMNRTIEPAMIVNNLRNYIPVGLNKLKDSDMERNNCHLMSKKFINDDDQLTLSATNGQATNRNDSMW